MARFGTDVVRTLGSTGGAIALGLSINIITARALGPDDRGIYSLCFLIVHTAVWFGGFQLGPSQVFHIGREGVAPRKVLGATLWLTVALSAALTLALLLAEPWMLDTFDSLNPEVYRMTVYLSPPILVSSSLVQFLRAMDMMNRFNVVRPIAPVLQLALCGTAFALGSSLIGMLKAVLVAELLFMAIAFAAVLRVARPDFGGVLGISSRLFRYGARLEAASAVGATELRVAGFIVAYFTQSSQIAFWSIGKGLADRLTAIPGVVGTVLLPKIARQSDADAALTTATVCRGTLFIVLGLSAAIGLAIHPLIYIMYGEAFLPAVEVLLALLPFISSRSVVRVLTRYIVVTDNLRLLAFISGVTLVANVSLLVLLVPAWGLLGAAVATSGAYVLRAVVCSVVYHRLTRLPYRRFLIVSGQDLAWMWNTGVSNLSRRNSAGNEGLK